MRGDSSSMSIMVLAVILAPEGRIGSFHVSIVLPGEYLSPFFVPWLKLERMLFPAIYAKTASALLCIIDDASIPRRKTITTVAIKDHPSEPWSFLSVS